MSALLEASFAHCRASTRGSNFAAAFLLLDTAEANAISAIYAFMRRADDLSDEPGAKADRLEDWRTQLNSALDGAVPPDPIWPAFRETALTHQIPRQYFHDMIDGVSSDLTRGSIETYDELYRYCYRVASVAGLSLMHIFGNRTREALELAEKCGVAFQLTNILRDVKEDLERGRVYLPREDMQRFGVSGIAESPAFFELLRFEAERARGYYEAARPLPGMVGARNGRALWALIEIYSRLLGRIEQQGFPVLKRRVSLSLTLKLNILCRARWKRL